MAAPAQIEEAKPLVRPTTADSSGSGAGKKNLFGGSKAKKNVFNPFAKKTGPKPLSGGEGTVGNSFAKESNAASENKYGDSQ